MLSHVGDIASSVLRGQSADATTYRQALSSRLMTVTERETRVPVKWVPAVGPERHLTVVGHLV